MVLDNQTIETIKSSAPILAEHGITLTTHFYKRMLALHPELNHIFNQANQHMGRQPASLARAIHAAAVHIENLPAILPAIRVAFHKHVSLGVLPEHYSIVGENLLASLKECLNAPNELIDAWAKAYGVIADVFISEEKKLFEEIKRKKGGWEGFVPFLVISKSPASDSSMSIELKPKDENSLCEYSAGQYITVRAIIDGEEFKCHRQYSLSKKFDGNSYRITPKRDGKVSQWIHDTLKVGDELYISAPVGDFVKEASSGSRHVFLAGGIGITPLLAMSQEAVENKDDATLLYQIRSSNEAHLMEDVMKLKESETLTVSIYNPDGTIPEAAKGFIDATVLDEKVSKNKLNSVFYICGSPKFTVEMITSLREMGVSEDKIRHEVFAPAISTEKK